MFYAIVMFVVLLPFIGGICEVLNQTVLKEDKNEDNKRRPS